MITTLFRSYNYKNILFKGNFGDEFLYEKFEMFIPPMEIDPLVIGYKRRSELRRDDFPKYNIISYFLSFFVCFLPLPVLPQIAT